MALKCPKCSTVLEVRLTAAPPMQADSVEATGDVGELLAAIDDNDLDDRAFEFVKQTRERFEKYGERTRMSEKQMKWLRKLAEGPEF